MGKNIELECILWDNLLSYRNEKLEDKINM